MPNPSPLKQFGPRKDLRRLFQERKLPIVNLDLEYPEPNDFRESPEFDDYCRLLASILQEGGLMTIRAVNTALGSRARGHWTMDALDRVAFCREGNIDRYSLNPDWTAPGRLLKGE